MKIKGNKILITVGASGIGLGLAERFVKENNTVIVCGRRKSRLTEVSEKIPGIITRACDLSTSSGLSSTKRMILSSIVKSPFKSRIPEIGIREA